MGRREDPSRFSGFAPYKNRTEIQLEFQLVNFGSLIIFVKMTRLRILLYYG